MRVPRAQAAWISNPTYTSDTQMSQRDKVRRAAGEGGLCARTLTPTVAHSSPLAEPACPSLVPQDTESVVSRSEALSCSAMIRVSAIFSLSASAVDRVGTGS